MGNANAKVAKVVVIKSTELTWNKTDKVATAFASDIFGAGPQSVPMNFVLLSKNGLERIVMTLDELKRDGEGDVTEFIFTQAPGERCVKIAGWQFRIFND